MKFAAIFPMSADDFGNLLKITQFYMNHINHVKASWRDIEIVLEFRRLEI